MIYYTISTPLCLVTKCLLHLLPIGWCITSLNELTLISSKVSEDVLYQACPFRVIPLTNLVVTYIHIHGVDITRQWGYSTYFSHGWIISKNGSHCQPLAVCHKTCQWYGLYVTMGCAVVSRMSALATPL
jgi:hypothetical protein